MLTDSNSKRPSGMVQWSDRLSYGIKEMDDDHKVMIQMVNHMHSLSTDENETLDVKALLSRLADYALLHFKREEIVMKTCFYPEYDSHVKYHLDLEMQVFELLKHKDRQYNAEETAELLQFLSDWLYDHISTVDQTLTPYVAKYLNEIDEALKDTVAVPKFEP